MRNAYKTLTPVLFLFVALISNGASAQLNGNYFINSALPTNGTNFQTFTEFAVAVWSNGVSGPVVATVAPGSGPYNEQVAFNTVPGASAANTITVNGNGELLQFTATGSFPDIYTLKIASDYFTINNLHVKALDPTDGVGIYVTNNAKHITLDSNLVEVNKTSTVSSAFGILVSGATSYLLSGSLSDSLVITNNTVIGGYSCIQLSGEGFTSGSQDPIEKIRDAYVADNELQDFYATALWLSYTDNALVVNNKISRPTRTNSGTDSQTPAGITITSGSIDFIVEKNRIFNFAEGGGGAFDAIARGIYISGTTTALTSGTLRNNLIYGLRNNHSCYGMHINSWSGLPLNIYHNTIAIDQNAGTTVSPAFPNSGYQTAAINFGGTTAQSNINVMNNIFFVRRDGNVGKRIYYISDEDTEINSDYNVFYFDGLGTGETDFGYQTVSQQFIDLAAWQATGQDAHSIFADPQFTDPTTGNFLPMNAAVGGDVLGTSGVGVTDDILGNARSATPTPGAFEMEPCGLLPVAGFNATQNGNTFTFNNTSTDAISYSWNFGSASDTSSQANPSFTFSAPGSYTVTLIASNACGADTITQNITITGVNDLVENLSARLFPNPTNEFATLSFQNNVSQDFQIELHDATGRLLTTEFKGTLASGLHNLNINTRGITSGVYSLVIRSQNNISSIPLSIIR